MLPRCNRGCSSTAVASPRLKKGEVEGREALREELRAFQNRGAKRVRREAIVWNCMVHSRVLEMAKSNNCGNRKVLDNGIAASKNFARSDFAPTFGKRSWRLIINLFTEYNSMHMIILTLSFLYFNLSFHTVIIIKSTSKI